MGVLNIKDRIVARLLDHLEEIKVENRIVVSIKHHEAHSVAAHLINDFTQRDEVTGPLRHFHWFAAAQKPDKLHNFDVELGRSRAHGANRCAHALDIARMIRAQNVNHPAEPAIELVLVIGDVGSEISVATVGFDQRTVDIVAEIG